MVGWVQELYEVPESVDLAELCAEIREGMLAIDLPGILATFSDGTAQSPCTRAKTTLKCFNQ